MCRLGYFVDVYFDVLVLRKGVFVGQNSESDTQILKLFRWLVVIYAEAFFIPGRSLYRTAQPCVMNTGGRDSRRSLCALP